MLKPVFQNIFANLARQKRVYSSFKNHQRQKRVGLTSGYRPSSVQDAVYNILYNTPEEDKQRPTRHVLNCLVHNEPGVLSRLSGVLASRNFNIESLVVAKTEVEDLGRMTIVLKGTDMQMEQARRQLEDLVQVWAVLDYSHTKLVERELLMIKISILGPEHLHEQLPTAKLNEQKVEVLDTHLKANNEESPNITLRNTFHHLRALAELTRLFHGKILDVSSDSVIVQLCAKPERITSFMRLCKPFGIIEAARTGVMAMPRSPLHDHFGPQTKHAMSEEEQETNDTVDPTHLPPG
ncbi:small subunit of acetolactate synthase-domain-containing protein [Gilbertella persicaria]|uniref:small subunit of acetolactate synthase-domain-containing protein n=1 Tax=Gilbertella persicaria TaxID=101096 RepID=UPI002220243D|nr:small subunit of acetolactate synthase-domain-containing protein [Gilbertella persicaria]KAI8086975.1 small subunit of acetolactate synthase-domain-containing protein [Gilbertella persicaria]